MLKRSKAKMKPFDVNDKFWCPFQRNFDRGRVDPANLIGIVLEKKNNNKKTNKKTKKRQVQNRNKNRNTNRLFQPKSAGGNKVPRSGNGHDTAQRV